MELRWKRCQEEYHVQIWRDFRMKMLYSGDKDDSDGRKCHEENGQSTV